MKKQYLICMLMIMLMLCGCTAAASGTGPEGAEPGLPAAGNPPVSSGPMNTEPTDTAQGSAVPTDTAPTDTAPTDTAQVNTGPASTAQVGGDVPWTDYGVGDGPLEAEETQYGHALNREEQQAMWTRLEGKWILSDSEEWKQSGGFLCPVYEFSVTENGDCTLLEYSAYGSGAYGWDWTAVREQNGVYTVRVSSESGEMTLYDCHQNSGTRFTLQFTENGILLARSRPTRFEYWKTQQVEEMNTIMVTRLATEEECERLANEGDEYGQLRIDDAGFQIVAGYEQPSREYRSVTEEELERLVQETGE